MVAFVFFRIVISVISLEQKQQLKTPAFSLWIGAWWTSCPKITPKYAKLSGAWPIYLSGSDLVGPARRVNLAIITLQPLFGGETYLAGISVPCTAVYHLWHLNLFGWWLNVEFQFWGVLIGYKSWAVQTKTYRHFRTCQDRHVARPYNTYRWTYTMPGTRYVQCIPGTRYLAAWQQVPGIFA